jgi:hypothetical protein
VAGWDPTTGFGSIKFPEFYNLLLNHGYEYTPFPTAVPITAPTQAPTTLRPTQKPSTAPTVKPSSPTAAPTTKPTAVPSTAPTVAAQASAKSNKSNLTIIIVAVIVVAIAVLSAGCLYSLCCTKEDEEGDDTKLLEDAGIAMSNVAGNNNNKPKNQRHQGHNYTQFGNDFHDEEEDIYFGDLGLVDEDEFRTIPDLPIKGKDKNQKRKQEQDDVDAANLEMLENVLFSAETNEYEERKVVSMFDHISEGDISSSVKKLGMQENDLENFLFSADANEYGTPASTVFTSVAAKSISSGGNKKASATIDPEMENIMFSADTNEYSADSAVINPLLRNNASSKPSNKKSNRSESKAPPASSNSQQQKPQLLRKPEVPVQPQPAPAPAPAQHSANDADLLEISPRVNEFIDNDDNEDEEPDDIEAGNGSAADEEADATRVLHSYGSTTSMDFSSIYGAPSSPRFGNVEVVNNASSGPSPQASPKGNGQNPGNWFDMDYGADQSLL